MTARRVFALALGAYLALSVWLVWRSAVLQPYSDMFEWVDAYYRWRADGDLLGYLLAPHNLHRLAWTRGVLALDVQAFGANGYLFVAVGAACMAALALLMAREAAKAAGPGLALAGGGLAAMLTLMAGNLLDASIHINTPYAHGLVFAVAALALAEPSRPGAANWGPRLAALACLALGSLGNAVTLAAWPVMLFAAWRIRDWRWLAILAVLGGAFIALYVGGQPLPSGGGWSGERIVQAALLALNYLGLPWTRAVPALGWVMGVVMLSLAALGLLFRGGPAAPRHERLATQLILFSIGSALMAGLARTEAGQPSDVPLRYAVFLIPLHVGLLMLALPIVARLRATRPGLTEAGLAACAVLLVGHQLVMGMAAVRTTDVNRRLIADFRAGQRTPAMVPTVHTDLAKAQALSERMARDGLFQRELHLPARANP